MRQTNLRVGSPADDADEVKVVEGDHLGAVLLGGRRRVVRRGALLHDAEVAAAVPIVRVGRHCKIPRFAIWYFSRGLCKFAYINSR